jgi:hypothetical protein
MTTTLPQAKAREPNAWSPAPVRWAEAGRSCTSMKSSSAEKDASKRRPLLLPPPALADGAARTGRGGEGHEGADAGSFVQLEALDDTAAERLEQSVARDLAERKALLAVKRDEVRACRLLRAGIWTNELMTLQS